MMKKLSVIGLAFVAVMFLAGCPTTDDGGGDGADFDSTLYYTKAELDIMFDNYYDMTSVDALLPTYGGTSFNCNDSNMNYATGKAITIPTGAKYLFIDAKALTAQSADVYVRVGQSDSGPAEATYSAGSVANQLLFFDMRGYTSGAPRIWAVTIDSGESIRFVQVLWLK
jgi:hypothetical protein